MLCLIKIENIFGRFCGDMYNNKYPKGSLPPMHLLIFLNSADKFLEASHINEIIYVKPFIIETDQISELTKIMTLVILHGPCREINPNSACINNA